MPNLKLDHIENIKNMMEHREKEPEKNKENPADTPKLTRKDISEDAEKSLKTQSTFTKIYAKHFKKVGSTIKSKYENGNPPRLHKALYSAIVKAMDGADEAMIILTPILERLDTSRSSSLRILSCLEAYGYLEIKRAENIKGKGLIFRIPKIS